MYVQKSFMTNNTFANNTPGVVATIGELSDNARTFAREKGIYSDKTNAPNLLLHSFISKLNGTAIVMPNPIWQQTLNIGNFIYTHGNTTATVLLENLLTNYAGLASDFACGNMITAGGVTLPEWVSWKCLTDSVHTDNFNKVWFVDSSFQLQYDETEIYVVPPFDALDNFFKAGDQVQQYVSALTSSDTMNRIMAAKQGYAETYIRTNTFNWVDPLNANHTIATDWSVLIYGPAGDNPDSIKDALMAYILAHSTHGRDDWVKIFPDIFKRTEFIILPLWDQLAVPNKELTIGIYSPQVSFASVNEKMGQFATQYPQTHIDANLTMYSHPYRSLALCSVGSPDNRNAVYKLPGMFPDLIAVSSTSLDFNRMKADTQTWAVMLEKMLVAAETVSQYTSVPVEMHKVTRDGILYVTQSFQNVNYLVVAKSSVDA
jgi:hypothetical protein